MAELKQVCQECDKNTKKLYVDWRDPPLELGKCLCKNCSIFSGEERIDELECEIEEIKKCIK